MNAASKHTKPSARKRLSILIADDNRDQVVTLAALLTDEGHIIHEVMDANLVLQLVERYRPEVCILDLKMPGASGYALGREIAEKYGDAAPWLIAFSGTWHGQTDRLLARSIGFDYFFMKPVTAEALLKVLADIAADGPDAA